MAKHSVSRSVMTVCMCVYILMCMCVYITAVQKATVMCNMLRVGIAKRRQEQQGKLPLSRKKTRRDPGIFTFVHNTNPLFDSGNSGIPSTRFFSA